jgi:hypothetical protein
MIERLEVMEETECGAEPEIILACRRELLRLFTFGGALVFGLGQAMAMMGAG